MTTQAFEVGGCIRDRMLGLNPKDIDYTVTADSYDEMRQFVLSSGLQIVVDKPEYGTIRAVGNFRGYTGGLDFVWARIDGPYSDGRRPDWTRPGTLMDDLSRRDFTVNAMAQDEAGGIIDPFGGEQDLANMELRAVGSADERIAEDPLRMLRALRFVITKGFRLDGELRLAIYQHGGLIKSVSEERIREELRRMFNENTLGTLRLLEDFESLRDAIFGRTGIWLLPTLSK